MKKIYQYIIISVVVFFTIKCIVGFHNASARQDEFLKNNRIELKRP